MTDALVAFIKARLKEDVQSAHAAHAPNWSTDGRRGLHYGVEDDWMTDALTTADAAHIARQDPARTLREVEAKRRIVDLCSPPLVDVTGPDDSERQFIPGEGAAWGEPVLRLLALPYSGHPEYEEALRS